MDIIAFLTLQIESNRNEAPIDQSIGGLNPINLVLLGYWRVVKSKQMSKRN